MLLTVSTFATTAGWRSGVVTLPATQAKYDLHMSRVGANATVITAVSLFELD